MNRFRQAFSNPVNAFFLKGFLIYALWTFFSEYLGKNPHTAWIWNEILDFFLGIIVIGSKAMLSLLGYSYDAFGNVIRLKGTGGVEIGPACVGLGLMYGISALILIFPGPSKQKMWFIPLAVTGVLFLNMLRVTSLVLISKSNPAWVDFNHKYVFNILVYLFIFLMWLWWVTKIGKAEATSIDT